MGPFVEVGIIGHLFLSKFVVNPVSKSGHLKRAKSGSKKDTLNECKRRANSGQKVVQKVVQKMGKMWCKKWPLFVTGFTTII